MTTQTHDKNIRKLLAAASATSFAAGDMIETARDGEISPFGNVGSGETTLALVEALSLLIEVTGAENEVPQLYVELARYVGANK